MDLEIICSKDCSIKNGIVQIWCKGIWKAITETNTYMVKKSLQTFFLALVIGQCPAKNWVMFDESYFTTNTVVRVKLIFFITYRRLKTQKHSVSIGLSGSGFSFYEHFNRQLTYAVFLYSNRKMCLSKKILYQYFVVFFALLGTTSPLRTFMS